MITWLARRRHCAEDVVRKLRRAVELAAAGKANDEIAADLEVSVATKTDAIWGPVVDAVGRDDVGVITDGIRVSRCPAASGQPTLPTVTGSETTALGELADGQKSTDVDPRSQRSTCSRR
jgi:hypothetical protein